MSDLVTPSPINERCPVTGRPVSPDAMADYRGRRIGFGDAADRDAFVRAVGEIDRLVDAPAGDPWVAGPDDAALRVLSDEIVRSYADLRTERVAPATTIEETAERVAEVDLDRPIGLPEAVREAAGLMSEGDLASSSARCFGYFNPTAAWPGVVADTLSAARNPQMCVVSHAPASVAMERRVVAWLLERLGFPADAAGNFTSGGSEANATALLIALVRVNPSFADEGVASFAGRPCLYASADSHLAWIKIARAAGLGSGAVRLVPTGGDGRLDPGALRSLLADDIAAGRVPVMIAATAGTTNGGEIDPLAECRAIADERGLHLHVDAAWAGALIVDPSRRPLLAGIEAADSVTIDAHKWLSVPMGAGMIFARDAEAVARAFAVSTGYMPAGDGADAYITTSQWSRRFIGLRLWMMLRATGSEAYRELFDRQFESAAYLRARLADRGWRIVNRSELPVILFEDAEHGLPSQALADALEADGRAWLGCVDYEGRACLRACMTSFLTERADLDLLLDALDEVRVALSARTE